MINKNEPSQRAAGVSRLDPEFDAVKKTLPGYLEALHKLKVKAKSRAEVDYKDHDLRKTVFAKYVQFFINHILQLRIAIEHEEILKNMAREEASSIPTNPAGLDTILINFMRFPMRNLRDESIEMVEHLMASILEAKKIIFDKKGQRGWLYDHKRFSAMLTHEFIRKVLKGDVAKDYIAEITKKHLEGEELDWTEAGTHATFLQCWANERNTRHRNNTRHDLKGNKKKIALIKLNSDILIRRLDRLLDIIQKITSHPEVQAIEFSGEGNDPLYDDLAYN